MTPPEPADQLAELAAAIGRPDEQARQAARSSRRQAIGAPGRLDQLADWLAGVQGRAPAKPPDSPRLLVLADEVPSRTAAVASDIGADLGQVTAGTQLAVGSAARTDAEEGQRRADAEGPARSLDTILAGAALVDAEVDGGTDLLLLALPGPALQVPAATLVGLLTGSDASAVTATGQDDAAWIAACAATRDLMRLGRPVLGDHPALLAAVGGTELALATGVLLGAAARRTPVLLDGPVSAAAALVAARIAYRAADWWLAAHLSPDPAHRLALARLSLEPLLDVGLRGDDGIGALLAVPLLRAANATSA